jgi:hypothetical protein
VRRFKSECTVQRNCFQFACETTALRQKRPFPQFSHSLRRTQTSAQSTPSSLTNASLKQNNALRCLAVLHCVHTVHGKVEHHLLQRDRIGAHSQGVGGTLGSQSDLSLRCLWRNNPDHLLYRIIQVEYFRSVSFRLFSKFRKPTMISPARYSSRTKPVSSVSWVQKNAPEDIQLKRDVIIHIDETAPPDVVIASSTSSIKVSDFRRACLIRRAWWPVIHSCRCP